MKRTVILMLSIVLSSLFAQGQTIDESYLSKKLIPLNHIYTKDFLKTKNESLSNLIGDKEIVMLGEQNHGDGNVFELKTRLIEYLHKFHDFDVVLFESDFFGGYQVFQNGNYDASVENFRTTLFPFWNKSTQMDPFWRLVKRESEHGLLIAIGGFDTHHFSKYSNPI